MKVAAYSENGSRRIGVVDDDGLWPIEQPGQPDILGFVSGSPEQRDQAYQSVRRRGSPRTLPSVRLLPPVTPPTIRDFVTFEAHVEGMVRSGGDASAVVMPDWYDAPTFYFSNANALVASGEDVAVPPGCQRLDFELEVAAVMGRSGRDLSPEEAEERIAGYTIFNDWSARDLGAREIRMGLGMAKAKDFATTLGPWLVTTDELERYRHGDRYDLELVSCVNGTEIGRDTLAHMAWSFGSMVAYASRGAWVRPGDVLASGTCGGGCLAEQWGRRGRQEPPPLKAGDVVMLEVQGIGTVTNRVVVGEDLRPIPRAASAFTPPNRARSSSP